MHSENSTGYFDLCFNGCETNLKQKVTWSKHTLSHCISRGTVRLKGLVYRVWSLVMSHACLEHGGGSWRVALMSQVSAGSGEEAMQNGVSGMVAVGSQLGFFNF